MLSLSLLSAEIIDSKTDKTVKKREYGNSWTNESYLMTSLEIALVLLMLLLSSKVLALSRRQNF
jgi:hypothetical protein